MSRLLNARHNWISVQVIAFMWLIGGWNLDTPALAADPMVLTFEGRSVDSAPYYYAFPYRLELVSIKHQKIYFSRHVEGEGKRLFVVDWDPTKPITLDSNIATKVTDTDLNTINFWRRANNKHLKGLIVEADKDKAEQINLWSFPDGSSVPVQITDVDYVYEFTQSDDHHSVYFTSRYGDSDASKGCLEELSIDKDGNTSSRQLICDDSPLMPAKISWWSNVRADSKRVIFPALKDGDRNKQELYTYDLSDGSVSRVFEGHGKSWVEVWENWGDETQALVSADRDLYRLDFNADTTIHLKKFDRTIANFAPAGKGAASNIMVTTETPFETSVEILTIDQTGIKTLSESIITEDAWLADGYEGTVVIGKFSPETYASFETLTIAPDGTFSAKEAVTGLADINDQLNRCDVERVQIAHEDLSKVTPGKVDLDAFIYRPRDLPPLMEQKFVITAYYGGRNEFSAYHHMWCALGITTISPAVRGDWRYGTEFANSNDREKADAPIRDTLAVARYLMDRFDLPSSRQIGTTGYSHGGWAAVRALSYPGPERLNLGFAIAGGGFYDLPAVVDPSKNGETNIHGWFDKEFGKKDQQDLLQSFSPINFLDQINAPIFLYHGERDNRISPNQAKAFANQLSKNSKPHSLMIVPEQGHAIRGPKVWAKIQQSTLNLIANSPK